MKVNIGENREILERIEKIWRELRNYDKNRLTMKKKRKYDKNRETME